MAGEGAGFTVFFVGWVLLGVVMYSLFYVNRDATWKRRWWPFAIYGTGVVFVVATGVLGGFGGFLLVAVPFVAFISWVNVRRVQFCDECGRTIYNNTGFGLAEFCSKCGAQLRRT